MHLRLAVLTIGGSNECKRDSLLLPSLQIVLATDWRIAAWNAVQQTNRREAGVRLSVLVTGIDDVKIVECELQRTFEKEIQAPIKNLTFRIGNSGSRLLTVCHLTFPGPKPHASPVIASPEEPRRANGRRKEARKRQA